MADVVCWVQDQGDRLRVTWSSGSATFPPYYLQDVSAEEREGLARAIEESLAALLRENTPQAALTLARAGHQLYRHLFLAGGEQSAAALTIQTWWESQRGQVTSLEVVGFCRFDGLWHLVYDQPPSEQAFVQDANGGECWRPFWGVGQPFRDGPRVHPLAGQSSLVEPRVVLAADHYFPEQQRQRLAAFAAAHQLAPLDTGESPDAALRDNTPDVLLWAHHTDGERVRMELTVNGGMDLGPHPGNVLAPREALPAAAAVAFGLDFLEAFVFRGEAAGAALQRVRSQHMPFGLAFTSSLPPGLRVHRGTDATPPPVPESEEEPPLPALPYRNLRPCEPADRALFTGREGETFRLSALVDKARAGLVLLHGPSGCGKTSLLQAGVLPFLEEDCPGFWALRDETEAEGAPDPLLIRATGDLAGQLARALVHFCARPIAYETPTGETATWDAPAALGKFVRTTETGDQVLELREALREDPLLFGRILREIAGDLPWQLLVVIDQGEELVTLAGEEDSSRRVDLNILWGAYMGARNYTILLALRTDAVGAVAEVLGPLGEDYSAYYSHALLLRGETHGRLPPGVKQVASFYLPELDEDRLVETILWPTATEPVPHTSEIPNDVYEFLFEEGLAETIAREALEKTRGQGGTLPRIQVLCSRLYGALAGRTDRVIRSDDLKKLGGVEPAIGKYLEAIVKRHLRRGERPALLDLLERLCTRRADGMWVIQPRGWNALETRWDETVLRRGGRPFEEMVRLLTEDDTRLLRWETLAVDGKEDDYVSLAHDALGEAAEEAVEKGRQEKVGRSRVVDTLWIMIPLTILVASLVFTLTTRSYSESVHKTEKGLEILTKERETLLREVDAQRYQANISQAEQALRAGNSLRAHQLLKESLSRHERGENLVSPLDEMRGFEWYYLWRQIHPERRTIPGFIGTYPCVAVSGDGKTLAVGGAATGPPGENNLGTVKLFDADTGAFREELRNHKGPVLAVALSRDGASGASADPLGTIHLWRLKDKTAAFDLREHEGAVRALAFSADGRTLASAGEDDKVILWDVATGKKREVLTGHSAAVEALAFSPNDQTLASTGVDKTVILWDAATGKLRSVLRGHTGAVHALAFSRDGKTLASGGADKDGPLARGSVLLWDVAKGIPSPSPTIRPPEVFALAYSGDDKTLFVGGKDNGVWLWDVAENKEKGIWPGHFGWVRQLIVSPDGKTLVTASYDRTAKVWDLEPPPTRLRGDGAAVQAVAYAVDGKTLASADSAGNTYLWDTKSDRPRQTLRQPKMNVAGVVLSRQGKFVVTAAWDGAKDESTLTLWETGAGKALKTVPAHKGAVTCLAISPDGKTIASGGSDRRVKLWRLDEEKSSLDVGQTLAGHTAAVRCVAFSPDGAWLASGGDDKSVWLWDPVTGRKKHDARKIHTGLVTALAFSGVGKTEGLLASTGQDRTVWIWSPLDDEKTWTWRGLARVPRALAFSPDGRTLAVAGSDRCVTLWDAVRDEPRLVLTGHTQPISCLAFAPDGQTLVSGGLDGDVRLWRAAAK